MDALLSDLGFSHDMTGVNTPFVEARAFGFERESCRPGSDSLHAAANRDWNDEKRFWARAAATLVGYRWWSTDHRTGEDRLPKGAERSEHKVPNVTAKIVPQRSTALELFS